jgi:hypothetical protein
MSDRHFPGATMTRRDRPEGAVATTSDSSRRPPFKPLDLYADLTAALQSELNLANHLPHWGEQGSALEIGLRSFLNRTLPTRFEALSGFAFGTDGAPSDQSDVLIIDQLACTRLFRFQDCGLFPIDAVMARIEVGRTLTKPKWKKDADRIIAFRKTPAFLRLEAGRCAPRGYLLGPGTEVAAESIADWYAEEWTSRPDDRAFFPNALVVPGRCVIYPVKNLDGNWAPWPDTEEADAVAFVTPDEKPDITLGFWLDLVLAQFQVLLDRRHEAHRLTCGDTSGSKVAPPFVPTLLNYFSPDLKMRNPIRLRAQ